MKSTSLSLGLFATGLLFACGGDDSTNIVLPDGGGGNDTSSNVDSSGGNDTSTGNDTGIGVDSSPGVDAASFNPSNVLGLVLWLDGAKGVTLTSNTVSGWQDQTSHKNDAKGLTNNFTARNPTPVNSGINSLPVVHFNSTGANQNTGNMLTVADNLDKSLQWGTGDFYIVTVAEYDNKSSDGASKGTAGMVIRFPFNGQTGVELIGNIPNIQQQTASDGLVTYVANGALAFTSNAYNTNKPHIFVSKRAGTVLDLRVDGASVGNGMSNQNVDNAGTPLTLGAAGDASIFRMNGDIAEVLIVKGMLTANDQSGIEGYLKQKYNTP